MTRTVDIANEVVAEFLHGWVDVGTSEVQVAPNVPAEVHKGILVRAPGSTDDVPNTAVVYVGHAGVTANDEVATGGWPLAPGNSVNIPISDPSELFVISGSVSQHLAYRIM